MTWKPHTPRAFNVCMAAGVVATVVSLWNPDSLVTLVGLPFAAFCFLDAGLVAVNQKWTRKVFEIIPFALAACAFLIWFSMGMASVPNGIGVVVAIGWTLVLLFLTMYCVRSLRTAEDPREEDVRGA